MTAKPRHLSNRTCGTCMTRTPPKIRRRLPGGARKPKGGDLKACANSKQDAPIPCDLRVCLARHAHGEPALAVHRYALHRRPHQFAKAGGNSNLRSPSATPTRNLQDFKLAQSTKKLPHTLTRQTSKEGPSCGSLRKAPTRTPTANVEKR